MRNIFVVGTGRSGTHLLCRTMLNFQHTRDFLGGVEDRELVASVASAAIANQSLAPGAVATLASRSRAAAESGEVFVDQSHPLLWFAEQVLEFMPESVFFVPWRPNEQILASMLLHGGVLGWYSQVRSGAANVVFPSRFFGIDAAVDVNTLSLEQLCLARIVSHKRECRRLQGRLGPSRIRFVGYEDLVVRGGDAIDAVLTDQERRVLGPQVGMCAADVGSLSKYAQVLTAAQIELARSCEA